MVGIDNSPDVLRLLQQRVDQLPDEIRQRVRFHHADARYFELSRRFPLVIIPANSLALLDSPDDRFAFFRCAHAHLANNGMLAFDYLYIPDSAVERVDRHLETIHEDLAKETLISTFGVSFLEDRTDAWFNIYTQKIREDGPPRHYLGAFRFARIDDLELETALERTGFAIVDRTSAPDRLMGTEVMRCFLQCAPRVTRQYPLWHPHYPMNDAEQMVTVLVSGEGTRVRNREGKEFIDASGGLWSAQCGLGRRDIIEAIRGQLEQLSCSTLFTLRSNEPAIELSRMLVERAPGALSRVYLTCSGSESVELSIKLARLFFSLRGQPERNGIIYLDRSYHGTFYGSMGVTGMYPNKERLGPHVPALIPIGTPTSSGDTREEESVQELERVIEESHGTIAAFIVEPILGSAGCLIPSRAWFDAVTRICRVHDILLIVDEVATGFGRTGRWFASEHFDLRPDAMLLSKGINSGYLPLGAVLFSERISETLLRHRSGIGHGSSANGNPACCAAAIATIQALDREGLVERAAEIGGYLAEGLTEIEGLPGVHEARGLGLMCSVEFALAQNGDVDGAEKVGEALSWMQDHGVLAYPFSSGLSFFPPLTIPKREIDVIVNRLASCVKSLFGA